MPNTDKSVVQCFYPLMDMLLSFSAAALVKVNTRWFRDLGKISTERLCQFRCKLTQFNLVLCFVHSQVIVTLGLVNDMHLVIPTG